MTKPVTRKRTASYYAPSGGLPGQDALMTQRAVFTESYAVIPRGCFSDIVTSYLPGWRDTRLWVIARPMSGFAETFSQYVMEIQPGGGADAPENDMQAQSVLFVTHGLMTLTIDGQGYELDAGGYAYIPPGARWTLWNRNEAPCGVHWIRKKYVPGEGLTPPEAVVTHEADVRAVPMPGTDGAWATQRFVDPLDLRHDCHVNLVNFLPGARIPFAETHVMEHGLYVLQGTAEYLLNTDWVSVGPGDFMWLRAFCPQACIATGTEPFRYLLYKDVNRHVPL